jgi:hypothetical protein
MTEYLSGGADARVGDLSAFDVNALTQSLEQLLRNVEGVSWYESYGSTVDVAAAQLCLLRRAKAGAEASTPAGDDAVRAVLARAEPAALVWLLSRAVSYMDEQGFPDLVPGARVER